MTKPRPITQVPGATNGRLWTPSTLSTRTRNYSRTPPRPCRRRRLLCRGCSPRRRGVTALLRPTSWPARRLNRGSEKWTLGAIADHVLMPSDVDHESHEVCTLASYRVDRCLLSQRVELCGSSGGGGEGFRHGAKDGRSGVPGRAQSSRPRMRATAALRARCYRRPEFYARPLRRITLRYRRVSSATRWLTRDRTANPTVRWRERTVRVESSCNGEHAKSFVDVVTESSEQSFAVCCRVASRWVVKCNALAARRREIEEVGS